MEVATKSKPKSKKVTKDSQANEHGIGVLKEKYKGAQEALDKFDRKSEVLKQEERIEQAQQSFIDIVEALHVIEEQGLFRYLADSMTEYCRIRWGWGSATVTRHKNAYDVLQAVEKFGVRPLNEGQARQLYKYATTKEGKFVESRAAEIWAGALNLANELNKGKVTAEIIRIAAGGGGAKRGAVPQRKGAARSSGAPVQFDVVASKEDVQKLEDALGFKPKTVDGMAVFVPPKSRTNYKLMLTKVSEWFAEKGHRSITINLSK